MMRSMQSEMSSYPEVTREPSDSSKRHKHLLVLSVPDRYHPLPVLLWLLSSDSGCHFLWKSRDLETSLNLTWAARRLTFSEGAQLVPDGPEGLVFGQRGVVCDPALHVHHHLLLLWKHQRASRRWGAARRRPRDGGRCAAASARSKRKCDWWS